LDRTRIALANGVALLRLSLDVLYFPNTDHFWNACKTSLAILFNHVISCLSGDRNFLRA